MFDRESRLFDLSATVMSVGDDDAGGAGGGDAGGESAGGDAQAEGTTVVPEPGVDATGLTEEGEPAPEEEEQAAAPEAHTEEEQIDPAVMEALSQLVQPRQAQPQQSAFDPNSLAAALAPVLQPLIQQQTRVNQILEAAAQGQRQAQAASQVPKRPGPDATPQEYLKFIDDMNEYRVSQSNQSMNAKLDALMQRDQQRESAWQRDRDQGIAAQKQLAIDKAYDVGIQKLSQLAEAPHMKAFADPDAAAILRAVHERLPNMGLTELASHVLRAFGAAPKTAASVAAARRTGEKAALVQQRQAVRQPGKAIPAAAGNGKAGPVVDKTLRAQVQKMLNAGMPVPADVVASVGITPRR